MLNASYTRQARSDLSKIPPALKKKFGISRLRDGQKAVIDSVLAGHNTLAIMPTGAGKSLCYQIPAVMLPGMTIVVSPLISLMKDQLEKLTAFGIRGVQVNSSLRADEEAQSMELIAGAKVKIIFCTPERLTSSTFLNALEKSVVSLIVIDEAHCISQWGHDFRPAYVELAAAIKSLGSPGLLALTATATDDVISDIKQQLGAPAMTVINTGIYRNNLRYRVIQTTNSDERVEKAVQLVRESDGAGIVYAATVKAVEELHALLVQAGESVSFYHGRLPAQERKANQDQFMSGACRVMVATNAFGMGIDKPDTRFVLHLQIPANLEAYYQESGRAGRDGLPAECTLLFLQEDKRVQQFFLIKHAPSKDELKTIHATAVKLNEQSAFTFAALKEKLSDIADNRLKIIVKLLKDGRILRQDRKLAYSVSASEPSDLLLQSLADGYRLKHERDREALEQMVSYAQSGYCRWKLLREYFGESDGVEQCGNCDNCLAPPEILHQEIDTSSDREEKTPDASDSDASSFVIGQQVRVPKFDQGVVQAIEGEKITITFPDSGVRIFIADYVEPA